MSTTYDEKTLRFVYAAVEKSPGLITGSFARFKKFCGIPYGIERCAVGEAFAFFPVGKPSDRLPRLAEKHDLDYGTLVAVIGRNDRYDHDTKSGRRDDMLSWLKREISKAAQAREYFETNARQMPVPPSTTPKREPKVETHPVEIAKVA